MSAKPCRTCGKLVVLAKDRETDRWIALTNQASIWRSVMPKEGVPYVMREHKLLTTHYCSQPEQPAATMPEPEPHFSEPKELPWSASE